MHFRNGAQALEWMAERGTSAAAPSCFSAMLAAMSCGSGSGQEQALQSQNCPEEDESIAFVDLTNLLTSHHPKWVQMTLLGYGFGGLELAEAMLVKHNAFFRKKTSSARRSKLYRILEKFTRLLHREDYIQENLYIRRLNEQLEAVV